MPRARFGTDGLRGVANADLTAELAVALGRAVARVVPAQTFVVGRDTRRSGPLLQAALSAGLATEGGDVTDVGVIPTSGVAYLCHLRGLPGAMVSASHNPFADNGIKVFSVGGTKLSVPTEEAVEYELDLLLSDPGHPPRRPTGYGIGVIRTDGGAADEYRGHLCGALEDRRLGGLRVVLDCANGAASAFAPEVFAAMGAEVLATACEPDGANINRSCGSTSPEALGRTVVDTGADLGLAFDGDADRLVAVDHTGAVADGDVVLALFAVDMAERGLLPENEVVVTVMTNLGFHRAMAGRGISVRETPVGDRNVLEALDLNGLALGGEQSGHIVFRRQATTGDGVLTGLTLADLVVRKGRSLAALSDGLIQRVPQLLVNVPVVQPDRLDTADGVWSAVAEAEAELGETGRVLLRASGTEPLVRVMVEAATEEQARLVAGRLRAVVSQALGPGDG
ncbi:MAG TPA: phosphoglucosamine mutase [Acidimicrobiales bacterium]|nr:phosphoglucosamine mutase [Acidimicrobiales bacterium]